MSEYLESHKKDENGVSWVKVEYANRFFAKTAAEEAVEPAATKLAEQGYDAVKCFEMLPEIVEAFNNLFGAAAEYVEYEHSGDPWEEDAREMGEMWLDGLKKTGLIADYGKILSTIKAGGEE